MSLPRVLKVGAQGQLEMHPAAEVEKLRGTVEHVTLHPGKPYRIEADHAAAGTVTSDRILDRGSDGATADRRQQRLGDGD